VIKIIEMHTFSCSSRKLTRFLSRRRGVAGKQPDFEYPQNTQDGGKEVRLFLGVMEGFAPSKP
jgi:hypothetical protein